MGEITFSTSNAAVASTTLSNDVSRKIGDKIKNGNYKIDEKLPKESDLMGEYGVSRTVIREAISSLQAAGLVHTRHGVGSFVRARDESAAFRVAPEQLATLRDTIALLEFRVAVEAEAAAIAASRRSESDLAEMAAALEAFEEAVSRGEDAAQADFRFHRAIAAATQTRASLSSW